MLPREEKKTGEQSHGFATPWLENRNAEFHCSGYAACDECFARRWARLAV